MEDQMSSVEKHRVICASSPNIEGLPPINEANKRQTVAGCCEAGREKTLTVS